MSLIPCPNHTEADAHGRIRFFFIRDIYNSSAAYPKKLFLRHKDHPPYADNL